QAPNQNGKVSPSQQAPGKGTESRGPGQSAQAPTGREPSQGEAEPQGRTGQQHYQGQAQPQGQPRSQQHMQGQAEPQGQTGQQRYQQQGLAQPEQHQQFQGRSEQHSRIEQQAQEQTPGRGNDVQKNRGAETTTGGRSHVQITTQQRTQIHERFAHVR